MTLVDKNRTLYVSDCVCDLNKCIFLNCKYIFLDFLTITVSGAVIFQQIKKFSVPSLLNLLSDLDHETVFNSFHMGLC